MLDLIERVEAAEGPDRELDAEIWYTAAIPDTLPEDVKAKGMAVIVGYWWGRNPQVSDADLTLADCHYHGPAYTASLDAAMMLVPEGLDEWEISRSQRDPRFGQYQARICLTPAVDDPDETGPQAIANAATPALALASAALKARSQSNG